jgi:hypothetical protein
VWVKSCPGVDEVGFLYVSTSSVSAVTSRFWLVFSQFGNELPWIRKLIVLPASSTV